MSASRALRFDEKRIEASFPFFFFYTLNLLLCIKKWTHLVLCLLRPTVVPVP